MPTIAINLSEDQINRLEALAARLQVHPSALLRVSVEELLGREDEEFHAAVEQVISKNAELYRRLA